MDAEPGDLVTVTHAYVDPRTGRIMQFLGIYLGRIAHYGGHSIVGEYLGDLRGHLIWAPSDWSRGEPTGYGPHTFHDSHWHVEVERRC